MTTVDLQSFAARSRTLVESSPPTTLRETRTWLVAPFLETLGWAVHGDSCATDRTLEGTRLEYVCSVDGIPALFVAVEPCDESLDRSRAAALLETMAWTGVDRAIYTNGRDYLLLAGTTDADYVTCRLPSLPDRESTVAHYSRPAVGQRLERHSRDLVARQLALERPALVETIVAALTGATETGAAYEAEFESAADRFLERLVVAFSDESDLPAADPDPDAGSDVAVAFSETDVAGETDGPAVDARSEPADSADDASAVDGDASTAAEAEPARETGSATASPPADGPSDRDDRDDGADDDASGDREYVVRFFDDRSSIGAIGHSRSDGILVAAAEYLLERGLSGVSVPWHPDETDARAVLNDSPVHPDGTSMVAPQQLSNGLYLETGGDDAARAARVEALASRAGLRAMLTGDWG